MPDRYGQAYARREHSLAVTVRVLASCAPSSPVQGVIAEVGRE